MATTAKTLHLVPQSAAELRHLPGTYRPLVIGQTLQFLGDPLKFCQDTHAKFGPVSRGYAMFQRYVNLMSAEANELVLLDREHIFSARMGWEVVLGKLFPRGLMLRDGDDHRYHRRLMQPAFRKEALAAYLERMNPRIAATIAGWGRRGSFLFYPELKRLTLSLAAEVFLGVELESEVDQVGKDFFDVVEASMAVVRVPVLGRLYARGLAGRKRLVQFIEQRIAARRKGGGDDLFSQLCRAEDEHGNRYSDEEIVDHLIFLMMAAHDTTTSALTTIAFALARHPEWQDRLRSDVRALGKPALAYAELEHLLTSDWVLREALRLYPPLSTISRRATREFEIHGHRIPANTPVSIFPLFTQRQAQWWSDPDAFDPERFSPARAEHKRHPFAWAPFGGGAHMCLGLHFAEVQVKAVLQPLLLGHRLVVAKGYEMPYQLAPLARPKDGLPIVLESL
jgi:cytochrome P450